MTRRVLASRTFGPDDQLRFATLTGDFNPLHMDAVTARRTQSGAPVVHGIHILMWMLDCIAAHYPDLPSIATLKVRFLKVVYLGDRADVVVSNCDSGSLAAEVTVGRDDVVLRLSAKFGVAQPAPARVLFGGHSEPLSPASPLELTVEQIAAMQGRVAFALPVEELASEFPAAHRLLGARRLAALGASTRLVGMVCPGLHSIYAGLSLTMCSDADSAPELGFQVTGAHPRLRLVRQTITGGGLTGTVESFIRPLPSDQASVASLASLVGGDEFADSVALIIGGSRGLGEVTAKLVAAGGGRVIITYVSGKADAERVAAEIDGWGGRADVLNYDVLHAPEPQLTALPRHPSHLYYYATPIIARRKVGVFDRRRFDEFVSYYVAGFYSLCRALAIAGDKLSVYYPSSVYVENWPESLVEYAMAKSAGELLCRNIAGRLNNVYVTATRLPPLATDQTATLIQSSPLDPAPVLLPVIRNVQGVR